MAFRRRSLNQKNMTNVIIVFGFILTLFSQAAFGVPLSLNDVLTSVDHHFPMVLSSQAELRRAQGEFLSAEGGFDPVFKTTYSNTFEGYYQNTYTDVSLEVPTTVWGTKIYSGWRNGKGTFPIYDAKLATFTDGEARVGIEVPLLKGGSIDERRAKIQNGEFGVSAAKEGLQSQTLEVKKQAAHRYWDWISSGRKVQIAKDLLDIALGRDEAIKKRILHGDLPEFDQVDNQRSILQRQSCLIAAERAFQKASLELSVYFRDAAGKPVVEGLDRLSKVYSTQNFERIIRESEKKEASLLNHPELRRIGSQIQQSETDYRLSQNLLLPKLDFRLGVYSDFGINPGTSFLPPSGYPTELRVSVSFEFPILFRSARGRIDASRASLDKWDATRQLVLNRLEIQIKDSLQAMKAAHKRLILAQAEITVSKKLEELERTRAFHGDSNFLLVNLREQATRDAMGKEIDAYSEVFKAKVDFEAASGEIAG